MVFAYQRMPLNDAATQVTADTTETQIGAGITVPTWANSIKRISYQLFTAAQTTDEQISGYLRVKDDGNLIEPFYLPLPLAATLTGAIASPTLQDISLPVELPVKGEDTLRAYVNLDDATTGVPEIEAFMLFSSEAPRYRMHSVMTAATAASTAAVTASAAVTLTTVAGHTSRIVGVGNYVCGDLTAAQTPGGYIRIESSVPGWVPQRIPTNTLTSGLSTEIMPVSKPVWCMQPELLATAEGVKKELWPGFDLKGRNDFSVTEYQADTNTDASLWRAFLYFIE